MIDWKTQSKIFIQQIEILKMFFYYMLPPCVNFSSVVSITSSFENSVTSHIKYFIAYCQD